MRQVVSDTGPVLHVLEAQSLHLLNLLGDIHIPEAVEAELITHIHGWQKPIWMKVDVLAPSHNAQALAWMQSGLLDVGEAAALALAQQLSADWFVTDDSAARLLAQMLGLEVHGSLGLVLWAAADGLLSEADAKASLEGLIQSSLWLSAKVVAEARASLQELFY